MIGDMEILTTDIIPLINKDWVNSIAESEPTKKPLQNVVGFHTIKIFLFTSNFVIL